MFQNLTPTSADLQDRLSQLTSEIQHANKTLERLRLVCTFFELGETVLRSPNDDLHYTVFHEFGPLLSTRLCDAAVWDWLQERARGADLRRQERMRIAVLELVPDPPIHWADLFRLWDMWFDPRARWAVYAAYVPFPRRVHAHLRRYVAHRRRQGLPLPEFSPGEFQAVLPSHDG